MTRLVSGDAQPFEGHDKALRPQTLAEFVELEVLLDEFADAKGNRVWNEVFQLIP